MRLFGMGFYGSQTLMLLKCAAKFWLSFFIAALIPRIRHEENQAS